MSLGWAPGFCQVTAAIAIRPGFLSAPKAFSPTIFRRTPPTRQDSPSLLLCDKDVNNRLLNGAYVQRVGVGRFPELADKDRTMRFGFPLPLAEVHTVTPRLRAKDVE